MQALGPFLQGSAGLYAPWSHTSWAPPVSAHSLAHAPNRSVASTDKPTPLPSYTLADAVARRTPLPESARPGQNSGVVGSLNAPVRETDKRANSASGLLRPPSELIAAREETYSGKSHSVASKRSSASYWHNFAPADQEPRDGRTVVAPGVPYAASSQEKVPRRPLLLNPTAKCELDGKNEERTSPLVLVLVAVLSAAIAWYLSHLFL